METTKTISKRLLAMMLSLAMVFSLVGANVFTASAKIETSGDFAFKTLKDGTVEITGYTGSANEVTIPSKINGKTVTSISDDFGGSFTSVTIGKSVKKIGKISFANFESLKNINVDEKNANYSSLNGVLFNKNKTILIKYPAGKTESSYVVPNGVKSIGDLAFGYEGFGNCKSLKNITIPDSVESIGSRAFCGTGLYSDEKNWENGVLYIGKYLIAVKNEVSDCKIKAGTKAIGDNAFDGCESLTSIEIPDSVKSIGDGAFYDCYSLKNIAIPNSVTSIGGGAFENCYSLKSIDVGEKNANYSSLNGVLFNKNKTILIKYPAGKTDSSYVIPNSVKSIGASAFYRCKLTSIVIPDSVESIGNSAFFRSGLKSIVIPDSVESIGKDAFSWSVLTSIVIPDSVKTIGDHAFFECKSLKSVTIGNGVKSIGKEAFEFCDSLKSVTIGNGVESIGEYAFSGCNFKSVKIPDSVKSIGKDAFDCCSLSIDVSKGNANYSSLNGVLFNKNKTTLIQYPNSKADTSYTIPNSVKNIGVEAFDYCDSLTRVKISNNVKIIGDNAFYKCKSLKSVTIGSAVKSIGDEAFCLCDSLTSITLPKGLTSIGEAAFSSCESLKSIKIPKGVTKIGHSAFERCRSLKKIEIPSSVKSIGYAAFEYCYSLESAKIAGNIKTISGFMFNGCKKLKSITIPKSVTEIGSDAFYGCKALKKITYNGKFSGFKKIAVEKDNNKFIKTPISYVANKTTKKHTHTSTKVKNKKAATYFKKGYTGDTICKTCGMIVKKGETTDKKTPKDKIKVTAGKNQIKIKYTKVTGATGFRVVIYAEDLEDYAYITYDKHFKTKKSVTKTIKNLTHGEIVSVYVYKKSGGKTVYSEFYDYDI